MATPKPAALVLAAIIAASCDSTQPSPRVEKWTGTLQLAADSLQSASAQSDLYITALLEYSDGTVDSYRDDLLMGIVTIVDIDLSDGCGLFFLSDQSGQADPCRFMSVGSGFQIATKFFRDIWLGDLGFAQIGPCTLAGPVWRDQDDLELWEADLRCGEEQWFWATVELSATFLD